MVLNSSGEIGFGGTSGKSINLELGLSATANTSLNDGRLRALSTKLSGQNALSNFYSKRAPQYWWSANYGMSTSGWTAITGGLDFTFYNVTSADSTNGVYFNGTSGYGATGNLSSNIDAKHIFMRFNTFTKPFPGNLVSLGGGSQNNIHEFNAYFNSGGYYWYTIERLNAALTYANRGTDDVGSTLIWLDFANGGTNINMYIDGSDTAYTQAAYTGTFNNRFRWESGYNILIGRRQEGNYANYYLKELAIFTDSLTFSEGDAFRDDMNTRWP